MTISETSEKHIIIEFKLTKTKLLAILTALFVIWFPKMIDSETLQLTTYYPAPYGGYARLLTTDNTFLATTGGNVGIGITNPAQKLEVSGSVEVSNNGNVTVPSGNVTIGSPNGSAGAISGWLRAEGLQGMCTEKDGVTGTADDTTRDECGSGYYTVASWPTSATYNIKEIIADNKNPPYGKTGVRILEPQSANVKILCCKIKNDTP